MKLIPAIDLKDNKCVRLSKGKESTSIVYNENPIEQAKFFEKEGCDRIHIVDIDAAFGRPEINKKTILKIRESISTPIELGGGIKNEDDIIFWFKNNINYLIIGSLATTESSKILAISNIFENKIYISLDLLDNKVMIKGWTEKTNLSIEKIINIYDNSKIKGYIFTDISRDGLMKGINTKLINHNLLLTKKPMIVGGGLANYKDLENLKNLNFQNLEGIVVGKAFYSGSIKINKAKKILN